MSALGGVSKPRSKSKSRSKSKTRKLRSKSKASKASKTNKPVRPKSGSRLAKKTVPIEVSHEKHKPATAAHTPKPVRLPSKGSHSRQRERPVHAHAGMNLTDLQFMAKSRGIQFGGLNKSQLVEKINRY